MAVEIPTKFTKPDTTEIDKGLKGTGKKAKKAGKKSGDSFSKGFKVGLGGLAVAATAATAALGTIFGGKKLIDLASTQQDAIKRLNSSLKLTGSFSEENSKGIQDFASSLQSVTRFGDEVILNQVALAKSFGATNEQAQAVAKTAADMSEALGIDFETATRNVATTLSGSVGLLGKTVPALKNLTQEQLKAGDGIALLAKQFDGFAANNVKTFSGAMEQAQNSFGDVLEKIGDVVVKSPLMIKVINTASKAFDRLGSFIQDNLGGDTLGNIVKRVLAVAKSFIPIGSIIFEAFARPFRVITGVASAAFKFIGKITDIFMRNIGQTAVNYFKAIRDVLTDFFDIIKKSAEFVYNKVIRPVFNSIASFIGKQTIGALSLIDPDLAEDVGGFGSEAASAFSESFGEIADVVFQPFDPEKIAADATSVIETMENFTSTVKPQVESVNAVVASTGGVVKKVSKAWAATGKSITNTINQALGQTASKGIQALTKSLVLGEKGFANFGKQVLAIMGDMAIKIGETLVFTGIGIEALKSLGGAAAIAAGVGLIALGTILKSLSGGAEGLTGGGAASGGGAGGGGFASGDTDIAEEQERQEQDKKVAITIEGNYFDTQESRLELVNLFNKAVETDGARVVTA